MMLEFTVGINIAGKHESVTVAAEDALIAALKVKCERPHGSPVVSTRVLQHIQGQSGLRLNDGVSS
jgi:hypothetical protein